jgi:diguanylate cyclase (GGDEF)-like protein
MATNSIKKHRTLLNPNDLTQTQFNHESRDLLMELNTAKKEIADQLIEKEQRKNELNIVQKELIFQEGEKAKRAQELVIANKELAFQSSEKADRAFELGIANQELVYQKSEKKKRALELDLANKELAFQTSEKANRASELVIANKELVYQKGEKAKRAQELQIANKELAYQSSEKVDRANELAVANKELAFQTSEKKHRADELGIANVELAYQSSEKADRATELAIANKELAYQEKEKQNRVSELDHANLELAYQKKEKKNRADELEIANKELAFQTEEKVLRASELITANKELIFQKGEKAKRAQELQIANKELAYQSSEKANRAAELAVANKELIFQKSEKADRALELAIANIELAYQSTEKADRASELESANKELIFQIKEKEKRAAEFIIVNEAMISQNSLIENLTYRDQLTGLYNRKYFMETLKYYDIESNLPISIIMGDINGLTLINDSLGYATVDEIIIKVTGILRKIARKNDIIIRLNNGEFALILPKTSEIKAAKIVKALKTLASMEKVGSFEVSISCGLKTKIRLNSNLSDMIKTAFDQLNQNKILESPVVENNTIALIMKMLFEKNNREMLHSSRVSEICENLAIRMNFDPEVIKRIKITGMLHDIGKIGIDEKILNKPGKLDEREWGEIKKHCEIGHRILSASNEFITHAEDVLKHHERMDGQGYPNGMNGEEITIVAKIISIADTYDALTSDRTYRKALSEDEALNEIIACSGVQFDPIIVNIFVDMIREKQAHSRSVIH